MTPGRDFGDRIEIVHGMRGDEVVITSPPDAIANGSRVEVAAPTAAAMR